MNLLELLAWAIVELQGARPNVRLVSDALEAALQEAAKLSLTDELKRLNLVRLAMVCGMPEKPITGDK